MAMATAAYAAEPAGYLTVEQVEQCLRAHSRVVERHEVLVEEKKRLDAISEQFRGEASSLQRRHAELDTLRRRQDAAEARASGIHTGRSLSPADFAAIDAQQDAVLRSGIEFDQLRADYNRALDDHNRRYAHHYAQVEQLNRRLDIQRTYAQMTDARCSRSRILQRDLVAAQAVIAKENAAQQRIN